MRDAKEKTIGEMLSALPQGERRFISFSVGKHGSADTFTLHEGIWGDRVIASFTASSSDQTLAALHVIDEAVRLDDATVWTFDFRFCRRTDNKGVNDRDYLAAPVYERRMIEQERLLSGEIKHGHKAFGFYPLDGH